jgi:hypothetical protein
MAIERTWRWRWSDHKDALGGRDRANLKVNLGMLRAALEDEDRVNLHQHNVFLSPVASGSVWELSD